MKNAALFAVPISAALFFTNIMPAFADISTECRALFAGERISLIVPNSPGGGYDTYARAMAPVLEDVTGARVSVENLPGAGGQIAARRIIEAEADEWVLLVAEAHDMLNAAETGKYGQDAREKMRLMSVFHAEPSAWIVRREYDARNAPDGKIMGGASAENEGVGFKLVGLAMGATVEMIVGYTGTSAMSLGLLGGEIDTMSSSVATAQKVSKAGDLKTAFVLSDGPYEGAPDLPYLLGEGGYLEARMAAISEAERVEAERLAKIAIKLGYVLRTVIVPTALPPERMACLESTVNDTVFSDAFQTAAKAEGREVNPLTIEGSQAAVADLLKAMAESVDLDNAAN